jgi:hypothetical protein
VIFDESEILPSETVGARFNVVWLANTGGSAPNQIEYAQIGCLPVYD